VGYNTKVLIQGPGQQGLSQTIACHQAGASLIIVAGTAGDKARLLIQGEVATFPDFPVAKLTEKAITIKSARGHSFRACELAIEQLTSRRYRLNLLTTHTFGLREADLAIRSVGGGRGAAGLQAVVHVSLLPWRDRQGTAPAGIG
jgi:threonine dehydrogenase-like Zn-dependent dehydrogenase